MPRRSTEPTVDKPSPEWDRMEAYRALPRDLRGGVLHVQALGETHLWKSPRERQPDFDRRLKALQLDPFYWSAMEHLGGQPFVRPVGLGSGAPPELEAGGGWGDDIDLSGRDLRQVARSTCISSVGLGLTYLWVLWDPDLQRPYVRVLDGAEVLDAWEEDGVVRLHLFESKRDPDRPWIKMVEDRIWVLYDGEPTAGGLDHFARYDVYEREKPGNPKSPFLEAPNPDLGGYFSPQEKIPLYPLYTGNGSCAEQLPWIALPPIYDLAAANRVYMNKRSDLDFGLHLANVPQRAASGLTEAEAKKLNTISHKGLWWMQDPKGKFYFVEHSGTSFEVARLDLQDLERRMEVWGLQPMISTDTGGVTATGRMIDLSRATTTAQAWTLGWEDTWTQALHCAARYARRRDEFEVTFFTGFGPAPHDIERAKLIQQDYLQGDLDAHQYFEEMQRLGVYSEAFDVEAAAVEAKKRADAEMKRLATMPTPGGGRTGVRPGEPEDQPNQGLAA